MSNLTITSVHYNSFYNKYINRPICLDDTNEVTIIKGEDIRRSRSGTVGQKGAGDSIDRREFGRSAVYEQRSLPLK
jgi:hypothetical protein